MSQAEGRYHHGNLREALLEQAHALLVEEGIDGVSLRQVAARAGVSRTAPYHHFDSKEALLAALVQRGWEQLVSAMAPSAMDDGPVMARFREVGRAYIAFALREPPVYRIMCGSKMLDPDRHPEAVCAADRAFDLCLGLVSEGQRRGEIGGEDPRAVAIGAWSMVHGLSSLLMDKLARSELDVQDKSPLGDLDRDAVIEGVLDTLEYGLRAR